jgi:CHASE2 domain-containing sensor protein
VLLAYVGRFHDPLVRMHLFALGLIVIVGGIYVAFGNHGWYWHPLAPALAVFTGVAASKVPLLAADLSTAIDELRS